MRRPDRTVAGRPHVQPCASVSLYNSSTRLCLALPAPWMGAGRLYRHPAATCPVPQGARPAQGCDAALVHPAEAGSRSQLCLCHLASVATKRQCEPADGSSPTSQLSFTIYPPCKSSVPSLPELVAWQGAVTSSPHALLSLGGMQ